MLRITCKEEDRKLILEAEGHAGYSDLGKDIVCASASMLTCTWAQAVTDMHLTHKLDTEPHISLHSGRASIVCVPKRDTYDEALIAFGVIHAGFNLLAANYPRYVEFIPMDTDKIRYPYK